MTADPEEIAKFEAMAAEWWDPEGKFKPLHMMNPVRLDYIVSQITAEYGRNPQSLRPLDGLRVADVGCGGGLLSEPMARLGAEVVGIDASEGTLPVARLHAKEMGLEIDYRHTTAEALAGAGETFDAVLAMEIVEHVPDPASFLAACARLVRPGGLLILSTISRTAKSYAVAIVGAERIMRWLPPGTHDWSKLITADELQQLVRDAGMEPVDAVGFVFDPVRWDWRTDPRDLSVNYAVTAVKTA